MTNSHRTASGFVFGTDDVWIARISVAKQEAP